MKAIIAMIILAVFLTTGLTWAQETGKADGKAIMISIRLYSEVEGKSFTMAPKVLTREKTQATVTIGNTKDDSGGRDAKNGKDNQDLFVRIEVTPSVVEGVSPTLIKMDIRLSLSHNGYMLEQSYQTVVREDETFNIESSDRSKNQKLAIKISASIADKLPEKPHGSVEVKSALSSDR